MITDDSYGYVHEPQPRRRTKKTPPAETPMALTPTGQIVRALVLTFLACFVAGAVIYATAQPPDFVSSEEAVKVEKRKIPYDIGKERALQYKKCPDVITVYVWVGYEHTSSPQQQVEGQWEHFGQITHTQELGPIVGKGGTIIQVTVQKDPVWNEWIPAE